MHGQFVWYELHTPDVDAAIGFYPRFTGWGTQPFDADYMMWTTGGVPFAGIFRLTPEMQAQGVPPNWMLYVEADDVDATAAHAAAMGGRIIVAPAEVSGAGRFAVVQDPQGAVFGLYKGAGPSSAWDGTYVVGRFSWHELMTTDVGKATEFYSALFGWEQMGAMDMGGGQMYHMFGKGGRMYGGMYDRMPGMEGMHPFWLCYIHVKDVPKAFAAATKAGATVHRGPMDIPDGVVAILADPQGAAFALHHENAAAAAEKPSVEEVARQAVKAATQAATAARKAAKRAAKVARKAVKKAVKKAVGVAKKRAKKMAKQVGRSAANATARARAARDAAAKVAAKQAAKRTAKKSVKKSAKKTAKKTARKTANKTAKTSARKSPKASARKPARKPVTRAAKAPKRRPR